jgi:hypothetical protein
VNAVAVIFTFAAAIFLFTVPMRWAPLPLLIGASYMTLGQNIEVGPFHFTVIRILVAIGVVRVFLKREKLVGGWIGLDRMMVLFSLCAVFSSIFHKDPVSALVFRLGMAYDSLGLYFLFRIFIRDTDNILVLCKITIIALIPIAIEMLSETVTGKDAFAFLGGVPEWSEVRGGHVRAQGPFGHSILAGTVGAVCLPMAILFWEKKRNLALVGLLACGLMIISSRSSGPIMTAAFAMLGLGFWKIRNHMRLIRWTVVCAVFGLNIVMNAPVYYLLDRIDFTGSSTSYYRAALINAAIRHLNEWWLGGTDYTRNWMPYGVWGDPNNVDITNHYIKMGVVGGLPLMFALIGVLVAGFMSVGRSLRLKENNLDEQFVVWGLGSILFAHAATMISVSYFDQSIVFLYLVLAAIGSVLAAALADVKPDQPAEEITSEIKDATVSHYG